VARSRSRTGIGRWLLLSALIVLFDQLTKVLVVRSFTLGQRRAIVDGFFDLTLVYNKGAAFSFLAGAGGWQRWFFIGLGLAAVAFMLYLLWRHGQQKMFALGVALILGGAIGNIIDRILRGQVVDFVLMFWKDFYWPAFNVADCGITVGAALLILDELRRVRRSR
jgi:signal peptidase II